MEALQIGPLYLNWSLLSLLVSAAAGYTAVGYIMRSSKWKQSGISDLLMSSLAIGLLVWKLSPFLFEPSSLWRAPLKVIMSQGGTLEAVIGMVAAGTYLLLGTYRRGLPLKLPADSIAYGAAVFLAVHGLLGGWEYGKRTDLPWGIVLKDPDFSYHPVNVYEILIGAVLAVIYIRGRMKPGDGRAGRSFFLYGGIGLFAISLFEAKGAVSFLFTGKQWGYVLMMGIGLFFSWLYILWETYLERRQSRVANNDSKAQQEHERENEQAAKEAAAMNGEDHFDKRLDGPNRPAE